MKHKGFRASQKALGLLLVVALVAIPVLAEGRPAQGNDYAQGRADGQRDAKGSPAWILGGILCGVFAVLYCYIQSPSPPVGALVGKSSDYVLGYSEGYKTKRGKDAMYAWIGWGIWIVIYLAWNPFGTTT